MASNINHSFSGIFGEKIHIYEYLEAYENSWTVFADVVPCLQRLKALGVEIGIISNGDYNQQVKKLKNLGIERFFFNYDYRQHVQ
ncbi:HAD family hydrolase [Halalkalibacter alkalisediminis]|uniref:HAD family hydrolase n=1 Tax=Halalkalibacter alkalisediminis TaxID=935616 RepID=UPI0023616653|nr:HAD family hydrolase [Halalkalibacter alkalisediminis]